jgi:hypothetical protein
MLIYQELAVVTYLNVDICHIPLDKEACGISEKGNVFEFDINSLQNTDESDNEQVEQKSQE